MSKPIPIVKPPHPATLTDEALKKQCSIGFGRSSGPGGQHRNKVETAVSITHEPTGIIGSASERRSQSQNLHTAKKRLRMKLAIKSRTKVSRRNYQPSELWEIRRQGNKLPINPQNKDYPAVLAEALDVLFAYDGDVAKAAGALSITMSQLARLIRHEKHAFALVNEKRVELGLKPLR